MAVGTGHGDFLSYRLPTALMLLAMGFAWLSARRFDSIPAGLRRACVGAGLWLALPQAYLPDVLAGAIPFAVSAAYLGAAAASIWRGRQREPLPSRGLAASLLGLHCAVMSARAMAGVAEAVAAEAMPGRESWAAFLLIEAQLHAVGTAVALLAMAKERGDVRLQASLERMKAMATIDPLTDIPNRRGFDDAFGEAWRRCAREGLPVSVLLIDLDHFKRFNDAYGHPAGDTCLRRVAACIEAVARRPGDTPARLGGEEFALLLPGTDETGAVNRAEALLARIDDLALPHAGNPPFGHVTCSVGSATTIPAPRSGDGVRDGFMSAADTALYEAKRQGRARVVAASGGVAERRAA